MRNLKLLDAYRTTLFGHLGDHTCGAFIMPSPVDGQNIAVIASTDDAWDHVSASRTSGCPNWPEMEYIRRTFFREDEAVMQYHPPIADYVDGHTLGHPYCLHLWRPQWCEIPKPPKWMVGGMTRAEAESERRKGLMPPRQCDLATVDTSTAQIAPLFECSAQMQIVWRKAGVLSDDG